MKKILIALIIATAGIITTGTPLIAIETPSSTPTIEEKTIYRNVLETGDFLLVVVENTPYEDIPDINHSSAFIWRLIDTDGTSELGQSLVYDYNDDGYGYNVVAFYFAAADAPTWAQTYTLTLSGTPSAFPTPPEYNYTIDISDYSSLTDSTAVKQSIALALLSIAADLDNKWSLETDYSLLLETETGTVFSVYGEAFFRGAIYGVQALAPSAFQYAISEIAVLDDREWSQEYATNLTITNQYPGTDIETGFEELNSFWGVDYNLGGIIIALIACAGLVACNWVLGASGWRGMIGACAIIVILSRMGVIGLEIVALIAAVFWLYMSAKVTKVI